jgi:hypothetical protein
MKLTVSHFPGQNAIHVHSVFSHQGLTIVITDTGVGGDESAYEQSQAYQREEPTKNHGPQFAKAEIEYTSADHSRNNPYA